MAIYFAPMEGITGRTFRNIYEECFPGVIDKYFAPFISASSYKVLANKDIRELCVKNNTNYKLVPQILTKTPEDFITTAQAICDLGYEEMNLNLGCPSRTVVSKMKGAGLLDKPDQLTYLLDEIYNWAQRERKSISIKTRIGRTHEQEWEELLSLFNQYPVSELIIHPRTQTDYYQNVPRMEAFSYAIEHTGHSLCYNGDITTKETLFDFRNAYPTIEHVMIGRGFLMRPDFLSDEPSWTLIWQFHDRLFEEYRSVISGDKHLLYKMKELWCYLRKALPKDAIFDKLMKNLNKSKSRQEYSMVIQNLKQYLK